MLTAGKQRVGDKTAYGRRADLQSRVGACEDIKLRYPLQHSSHSLSTHRCELIRQPLCRYFSSGPGVLIKRNRAGDEVAA